jgi:hypothetical protein
MSQQHRGHLTPEERDELRAFIAARIAPARSL